MSPFDIGYNVGIAGIYANRDKFKSEFLRAEFLKGFDAGYRKRHCWKS